MSIFLPIAPDATCPDRAPDGDPHPDLFWQGTLEALFLFTVYFLPASLLSPPPPVSGGPTVRAPSMFYSLLYFQNPAQQRPSLSISAPATDTLFMTSRNSQGPLGHPVSLFLPTPLPPTPPPFSTPLSPVVSALHRHLHRFVLSSTAPAAPVEAAEAPTAQTVPPGTNPALSSLSLLSSPSPPLLPLGSPMVAFQALPTSASASLSVAWHISHKAWNKLMHALYGNTSPVYSPSPTSSLVASRPSTPVAASASAGVPQPVSPAYSPSPSVSPDDSRSASPVHSF